MVNMGKFFFYRRVPTNKYSSFKKKKRVEHHQFAVPSDILEPGSDHQWPLKGLGEWLTTPELTVGLTNEKTCPVTVR